eukprot:scaffold74307_cov51-Attheya_sp.AAC.9
MTSANQSSAKIHHLQPATACCNNDASRDTPSTLAYRILTVDNHAVEGNNIESSGIGLRASFSNLEYDVEVNCIRSDPIIYFAMPIWRDILCRSYRRSGGSKVNLHSIH